MKVTIVTFNAFDKQLTEAFVDKTFENIHKLLYNTCFTYQTIKVLQIDLLDCEPIDVTNEFKK